VKDKVIGRIMMEANYTIANRSTIRQTALYSGVSKSTVYLDLTKRLHLISNSNIGDMMAHYVDQIIRHNKEIRASRGGYAKQKIYGVRKGVEHELPSV
jgi:putative DeoR family transcriptional regulator (stage III sporulation protein D)